MQPTDTSNPDYFHRVVDCQWACPAHTDVPEYIRLIANGQFSDAYIVNRESNVFPGILGRVCDRPCEPACRRRRVERAMFLLRETERSVSEICLDVGFASLGTFSRRFTEIVGEPPTTYRWRAADLRAVPACFAKAWTRPSSFGEARAQSVD